MTRLLAHLLSRRERQIMDVLYQLGQATVTEVREALPNPPTYSTVRALMRVLETKGHVRHLSEGGKYIYLPIQPHDHAAQNALAQVVHTFFGGSIEQAVTTLVSEPESRLTNEELDRLAALIEQARQEGR